jgi:NAD-dependent deacetylase
MSDERIAVEDALLTNEQRTLLSDVAQTLRRHQPAIAFTGAGISTESGIPDFRGPGGLWKRIQPTRFSDFLSDPEERVRYWQRRRERYPQLLEKQPNSGHVALQRLLAAGLIAEIVTQNIDGLHQKAGVNPERIIELHGSSHRIRCLGCRRVFPADSAELDLERELPDCPVCGGVLKESTIAFGESLIEDDLRRALALAGTSAFVLVVGSSLSVNPAAKIPLVATRTGASLAIINNEPTPLDHYAEFLVQAPSGVSLSYLAELALDGGGSR